MARPSKKQTALRGLREAVGLTQKQLAARLGINFNTFQSYEIGRLAIPWEVAVNLASLFGVDPVSVYERDSTAPHATEGGGVRVPFTAAYYEQPVKKEEAMWRELKAQPADPDVRGRAERIGSWIEPLLEAAHRTGGLDSLELVHRALARSLAAVRKDFGLEKAVDAILEERPVRRTWNVTVGWLRAHPDRARALGYRRQNNDMDEDQKQLHERITLAWNPGFYNAPKPKED